MQIASLQESKNRQPIFWTVPLKELKLSVYVAGAAAPILIAGIATSSVGAATNIGNQQR